MNKNEPTRLPCVVAVVFLTSVIFNSPCAGPSASPKITSSGVDDAELNAEKNLAAATANPLQLRHFLLGVPKGDRLALPPKRRSVRRDHVAGGSRSRTARAGERFLAHTVPGGNQ
jgi:hypothetical protein